MIAVKRSYWNWVLFTLLTCEGSYVASAQTCSGTTTVTCTGGGGAHVTTDFVNTNSATAAQTGYGTTITVTGFTGQTVTGVTIRLNTYVGQTGLSPVNSQNMRASHAMGLLLVSPSGRNLEIMNSIGSTRTGTASNQNIPVLTIQDGATAMPGDGNAVTFPQDIWNQTASATFAPTSNANPFTAGSNSYPAPAPAVLHAAAGLDANHNAIHTAAPNTLAGVFAGDLADGAWKLYLVDNDFGSDVSFASWDLILTVSATASASQTTLVVNPTTAFAGANVTLTATVTGNAPTGSVTFKDAATNVTCAEGAQPRPLASGQAICTTTFAAEGIHSLSATYGGDTNNTGSSDSKNVFIENHSTNTGDTYCNPGAIAGQGNSATNNLATTPYPSVINVGAPDTTPSIANSVSTVSVQLKGFAEASTGGLRLLLQAPDTNRSFEFMSLAGAGATSGTYTFIDSSAPVPSGGTLSPGSYGPAAYSSGDSLLPSAPSPAPAAPSTFSAAAPGGSSTFFTVFNGANANGAWKLFAWNNSGTSSPLTISNGWCVTITPAAGQATTVTVAANPTQTTTGTSMTFTATITSGGNPVNQPGSTVAFTEGGSPLAGAPNGGIATVNSSGVATIATSGLGEGDHTITATFTDPSNTFNSNFGTVTVRVDQATSAPAVAGSLVTYCNPGVLVVPAGTVVANDIGPARPNPSNIFVTNLFGTINTVKLDLKTFHVKDPQTLASLLVGPGATTADTLDFFTEAGTTTPFTGGTDTNFFDLGTALSQAANPGVNNAPGSFANLFAPAYTASPFYTLPGTVHAATPAGPFTFNTGANNAYSNKNPNGTWSLYFDQDIHDTGNGADNGWCLAFTENPPTLSGTKANGGAHYIQGQSGAALTVVVHNQGPGSAGGVIPAQVADTFPAGLTPAGGSGTDWSCNVVGQTITCGSTAFVPSGSDFPTLTINFNVSPTFTPGTANDTAVISGSGLASPVNTNTLGLIVDSAPILSVTKSAVGTFTQGQTAEWDVAVANSAPSGATQGTTTVQDTLPTGYTIANFGTTSASWTCSGAGTGTASCTTSLAVSGGSSFPLIQLMVNVPAASPTSVSNTAKAFGGGDLTHTNLASAASSSSTVTVTQIPAHIAATSGSGQSANVSTAFANPLVATVTDAGGVAIANASVTFTAPPSGASAIFSNSTGTITTSTNGAGAATVTVSANGFAGGPYNVSATSGTASVNFALTNVGTAATITNVTSTAANGSYTTGAVIPISITFSKTVNVTGTPQLALNSGGTAAYTSGGGTATLTFTYTVGAGQNSARLDYTSTSALTLNGGTIADASTTAASLTLPAPGSAPSLSGNKNIVIDTVAPTVISYNVMFGAQTFSLTTSNRNRLPWQISGIQVMFSKPIASATTNSLGGVAAMSVSGVGTNTLTWSINPLVLGSFATTLAGSGTDAIKDAAGNALTGGAGFSQAVKILYGDFNDDGFVSASDLTLVNAARSAPYNIFADMNGDGVVDINDVQIVRSRIGTSLP